MEYANMRALACQKPLLFLADQLLQILGKMVKIHTQIMLAQYVLMKQR